jgi:hypothetical protein
MIGVGSYVRYWAKESIYQGKENIREGAVLVDLTFTYT